MNKLNERMQRADRASAAGKPMEALRILMGWTCDGCGQDFTPDPSEQPVVGVSFVMGLKVLCQKCKAPKEGTR